MYQPTPKALISGASGFIGAHLVRALDSKRIQTFQLLRKKDVKTAHQPAASSPQTGPERESHSGKILWEPGAAQPITDLAPLEGLDTAIHLSGANVSGHRWTESYKREIVNSRVDTTHALIRSFSQMKQPPRNLLCASAVGIYGDRNDEVLTEKSAAGRGFLADTCLAWEAAADTAKALGMRVIHLRFGVVLAPDGGALKQMLPIFRLGLGGRLGSGSQWMSWIALPDLIAAVLHLAGIPAQSTVDKSDNAASISGSASPEGSVVEGPVNLVAPHPVRNTEFTAILGRTIHRPTVVPAPAFALRLAFGEMADGALLASARVLPQQLLDSGFTFRYPDLASAFRALL